MKTNAIPDVISDDVVVTMDYTLTVGGKKIGSSKKSGPLAFIQGQHEILIGLENDIYGLKVGDTKEIDVAATDGYGEIDPDDFITMEKSNFPATVPMKRGTIVKLKAEDGGQQKARIDSVSADEVRLNFNHPLAGKELHFSVAVLDLRSATPEEIETGL